MSNARICPDCAIELETGHLYFAAGLVWHQEKLEGLKTALHHVFSTGEIVAGNVMSSGFMRSLVAARCPDCDLIIIFGEKEAA